MADAANSTLGEYAQNPDGTYSGPRAAEWLFAAMTGKSLKPGEAEAMVAAARQKAQERRDG